MLKLLLPFLFLIVELNLAQTNTPLSAPKTDVFLQGFYWNSTPGGIWWDSLSSLAPEIASAGFSAVWVPSPSKGAGGGMSMGYDIYDHFDFGEYYQKGSFETRFGSRPELINMINTLHDQGIEVFADAVMNHINGGEKKIGYECVPAGHADSAYLWFQYPNGSGRFPKDSTHFYPNAQTCDVNPPYHGPDDPIFAFGEWLAHDRSFVRDSLIVWGQYLKNEIGFDGFRLDAVKGIDPAFMGPWLQSVNSDGGYAVAEYFGDAGAIGYWLNQTQNVYGGNVSMFDFPLRYTLKDMCDNTYGSFDMNLLDGAGLVNSGISGLDVSTFVENHDMDRVGWDGEIDTGHNPIVHNKDMAYAYIIFSEGRPCVFFKDYFEYGFAGKIDTLMWIRRVFLEGGTTKRNGLNPWYTGGGGTQEELSRDIYVARRNGGNGKPQTYLVLNDNPDDWRGVWVDTNYPNGTFRDYTGRAIDKQAASDGRVELWAPPRGYAIYAPDTTQSINNPPVLNGIPDLTAYTNSPFSYRIIFSDVNDDNLNFTLSGNPAWLHVSGDGILNGTPSLSQTGNSAVILTISDPSGESAADTFSVTTLLNYPPELADVPDTTIEAAKRFEYQTSAIDPDNDQISFELLENPAWLNVGVNTGLLSGTPALEDTGYFNILLRAGDGKGAFDSTGFNITVKKNIDSIIATYGKPTIDGTVHEDENDWLSEWKIISDPDNDSFWHPADTLDNELMGIYSTWDADSLYLGIDYRINDAYNTLMLYIEAGLPGGVSDFNSTHGYQGDYAKNNLFRSNEAPDFFIADYYLNQPSFFSCDTNSSLDITELTNGKRGEINAEDLEIAISWNDLYGLGAGLIPSNIELQFVALIAGGLNWGSGDSAPDNLDTNGDEGPDSLIALVKISPDNDGDGIPDPTIIITETENSPNEYIPSEYFLYQNYPNPFNPTTVINYSVAEPVTVSLNVYDILGRKVASLVNKNQSPGNYKVNFTAGNLSSGIYFYRLSAGSFSSTMKMILLK